MHGAILENSAAVFTAIGTVAVAVLAIWGDWFKARLAGPRIRLALRDARGTSLSALTARRPFIIR